MKKGFTLIELLAVIVILTIIALIAVPIVIHIINDSKTSSEKESLNLYTDTVEKAITKKQMNNPSFNPDKCEIKDKGNLECFKGTTSLGIVEIEMKGQVPSSGKIYIDGNNTSFKNVVLNNKTYYVISKLISDTDNNGEISIGDKYIYKVNNKDAFNFYVLSFNEEDDTVNLIMDRNICSDGTIEYTSSNNNCGYAWHWLTREYDDRNNNYGPDIVMTNLYNATKNWTNVPDMMMNYEDENNKNDDTKGYKYIITDVKTKVTRITGKQNRISNYQTFGNKSYPLKARLPRQNEVTSVGCTMYNGSCPVWLMENMTYFDVSRFAESGNIDKYSMNNGNGITNIYGYWLLASAGNNTGARYIYMTGSIGNRGVPEASGYSARPVITVPVSDLN